MQTRAHAAAALSQLQDLSLLQTMRPSTIVEFLEAAAAVLQVSQSYEAHINSIAEAASWLTHAIRDLAGHSRRAAYSCASRNAVVCRLEGVFLSAMVKMLTRPLICRVKQERTAALKLQAWM